MGNVVAVTCSLLGEAATHSLPPDYLRWSPEPEADVASFTTQYEKNTAHNDAGNSRFTEIQIKDSERKAYFTRLSYAAKTTS